MAMATPTAGLSNLSIGGAVWELFFGTRAIVLVISLLSIRDKPIGPSALIIV
jgi:hypothetical protein